MGTPKHLKVCLLLLIHILGSASAFVVIPSPTTPASPPSPSEWSDDQDDYPTTPPLPPAPCNFEDRNTLLKIKQAFNNSDVFDNWKPDSDCCKGWNFVECDRLSGRVNAFMFFGNTPWGRNDLPPIFPPIIGNLSYLTMLEFINNATGQIPASLANLHRLLYLDLSRNRLSGPIPSFITRFQNLTTLVLSDNRLTGTIPTQLSQLSNLGFVSLKNNRLTGRIPEGLFRLFKGTFWSPPYLVLSSNKLKGPIPRSFGSVNFRGLELADNKLTGDASFVFGKDKQLWYLDLSRNKFSFNMSDLEVPSSIFTLLLNNNKIFGRLPTSLTLVDVNLLNKFNVSYNRLCGQLPVGGRLQRFDVSAYSHNKCLCGSPLPPCKVQVISFHL